MHALRFHQPTPALGYRREVAEKESYVKNRSLQVMGSWWWFWILCGSGIGGPIAVLYFLTGTVRRDMDADDPEQIAEDRYTGKLAGKSVREPAVGPHRAAL